MRIISVIYGHRRFDIPSFFNARPTTDFAKENLFNVLSNIIDWDGLTALDLFAGTGSIAMELVSRGCSRVIAVEQDKRHASFISKAGSTLGADNLKVLCTDAFRYLSKPRDTFDFIFADPPYSLDRLPDVPGLVLKGAILRDDGVFVMEHPKEYDFSGLPGFKERRVYGSVNFSIFIKEK
jgi:16S rRNA (guanine(966)-N(2))-methyltransferase RsmD